MLMQRVTLINFALDGRLLRPEGILLDEQLKLLFIHGVGAFFKPKRQCGSWGVHLICWHATARCCFQVGFQSTTVRRTYSLCIVCHLRKFLLFFATPADLESKLQYHSRGE